MTHHRRSDSARLSWTAEDATAVAVVLRRCYSSYGRRQHRQPEPRPAARQQQQHGGLERCSSLRCWWWERRTRVVSGLGDEEEDEGSNKGRRAGDGRPMGNSESADNRRRPLAKKGGATSSSSSTKSRSRATLMSSAQANGSAGGADDVGPPPVRVCMRPDAEGRFGFNVKGGADQSLPILVSRVVPHTPADTCSPRLREGDQLLLINGRDVAGLSHDQVVKLIRAPKDNGELVLTVKAQVPAGEQIEEPDFQYIPDSAVAGRGNRTGGGALAESMLLLAEGLESGATIAQFEQLYRKKADYTMKCARLPANLSKNRYRDISPYDVTRVILQEGTSGDYINASYVNMNIPTSGIVNRYIATQGPLPNTTIDFWEMVWEQQCTLVVMLTTLVERGRIKCHKYWPDLYETDTYGHLQVSCVRQKETPSFAFREFTLINTQNREERHITHMQYLAWPDHGVPEEASEFLGFVQRVRRSRDGMVEPTVVHCSAGIGRTGVLILMETAMCLIEANEPVYPLDLTRDMRDQRAMLIQTSSQYKFVCEAILKVYNDA
ncbi:hypothetical protein HPB49_015422 [Dermacentor silvarum]|uniref:Uncharacterized protein n=1 Tax=Dermacentor silvarum TaxID=543639 RepID=A0ACB8DEB3_DERSI|nr:hypothetical protein HPB49_015422 [Dermacentor silvarum]